MVNSIVFAVIKEILICKVPLSLTNSSAGFTKAKGLTELQRGNREPIWFGKKLVILEGMEPPVLWSRS